VALSLLLRSDHRCPRPQCRRTPDLFLFGADHRCSTGQLDANRPATANPRRPRLRAALEALLRVKPLNPEQTASIVCNIK